MYTIVLKKFTKPNITGIHSAYKIGMTIILTHFGYRFKKNISLIWINKNKCRFYKKSIQFLKFRF